jgi:hypothetical protein
MLRIKLRVDAKLTEIQFKRIGIFKCGNIGTSPLLELLLDELADRKDIKVRTVTTGSKMALEDVEEYPKMMEFNSDSWISKQYFAIKSQRNICSHRETQHSHHRRTWETSESGP